MFFHARKRGVIPIMALLVLLFSSPAFASSRNATIDVTAVTPNTTVRKLVARDYTVSFTKINPLRYTATLAVVPAATAAPTAVPTNPAKGTRQLSDPVQALQTAYNNTLGDYRTAANAVDVALAGPGDTSWKTVQTMTAAKTQTIADLLSKIQTDLQTLNTDIQQVVSPPSQPPSQAFSATTKRSTATPTPTPSPTASAVAQLVASATALENALSPIINNSASLQTELDSAGTCYSGGNGESDTLTLTPVLAGITAPATEAIKATIVCEPPLLLSAGLIVGSLGSPTYAANSPIGASPAPSLVPVTQTTAPVQSRTAAELHYRVCDIGDASSLFITGIGAFASTSSASTTTTNFDGGLGLSYSVAEDHLFFTAAMMGTTLQLARQDAGPPVKIPPGTQVPTVPVQAYRLVFGMSFRL